MRYYRYILDTIGTFEVSLVHRWYINVSSLYRFQAQKRYVIYSFIHVPILYQIGHISDIFGNPVQNRYTFFVPVKNVPVLYLFSVWDHIKNFNVKALTFCRLNASAGGSTIALPGLRPGELKSCIADILQLLITIPSTTWMEVTFIRNIVLS